MAKRQLGVWGANLPTKKARSVVASDFLIGGLVAMFERAFDKAYVVTSPQEAQEIFGLQIDSGQYGWDALNGFFANAIGVAAKLYISSHVGHTGTAIDAITATQNLEDGTPEDVLQIDDAYKGELGYGVSGNRTGVTVTNGPRLTTSIGTLGTKDDLFIVVKAIGGIKVGDIIKVIASGGGPVTVYKKITAIDESAKKAFFVDAFDAVANADVDDPVTVLGFRLRLWRKSITGIVKEVEEELGKIFCSTEPECSDFYAPNVFANSTWIKVTRLTTTPATLDLTFPVDVTTVTFATLGAAGTAPTTAAHWANALAKFDNLPARFIANPESTVAAIQEAIEVYCQGRMDNPKVIYNVAENQTKAQLVTIGQEFQRSDDVLAVLAAHWLEVADPFNTSPVAPNRNVPNVGHVMGLWIRAIGSKGIHYIPCTRDMPMHGALDVVGDQFLSDVDRTDLADAGVNVIQNIPGGGIMVRNFFTPSTAPEFQFANGLMLREYIKISGIDSLQVSENTPNSLNRIKEDKMAMLFFLRRLWDVGSTTSVPVGETFGQTLNEDGSETQFEDHVEVRADLVNNPLAQIQLGERNIDVYFTYPAPAGSIRIGVGILLRG